MKMNKYFDHTLLAANATRNEVEQLCKEAKEYDFMSVCVNPYFVPLAKKELAGSDVKVCTVIGFPLGQMSTKAKVFEANDAVKMGADEMDMVINVSALKDQDYDYVRNEMHEIKKACEGKLLKVILECCYLSKEEIKKASELAKEAGADFVKTSTGFGKGGAKAEDVKIMRETVGSDMGVKAAGGIHTLADFKAMVDAGANRIGCSHSIQIMEESKK